MNGYQQTVREKLGGNLWWTSIPSRGNSNTPSLLMLLKPGYVLVVWVRVQTFCLFIKAFHIDFKDEPTTGCVNVSVLMPVLAVAVFSLLLFIHLVLQSARRRSRDEVMSKKSENSSLHSHEHARVREVSSVIEEPIELHVNGRVSRMQENESVQENQVTQF